MRMLNEKAPHRKIRHPDFGERYVQDGMLFFLDGSPMGLAEGHRVERPAPALATDRGQAVARTTQPAKTGKAKTAASPPPSAAAGLSMAAVKEGQGGTETPPADADAAELQAALSAPFFTLKKFMRTKFGVDPQNKDAALKYLREKGLAA